MDAALTPHPPEHTTPWHAMREKGDHALETCHILLYDQHPPVTVDVPGISVRKFRVGEQMLTLLVTCCAAG